jgi:hypothetical protein
LKSKFDAALQKDSRYLTPKIYDLQFSITISDTVKNTVIDLDGTLGAELERKVIEGKF